MITATLHNLIQNLAQKTADVLCDLRRFSKPDRPPPKIVAHRGAWDRSHGENTLKSFVRAQKIGAWAIEFDIHFTRDGMAVVNHDPDLRRCHGHDGVVNELSFAELTKAAPQVPSAEQVLALKDLHFMIEIKTALSAAQIESLNRLLTRLKPVQDYHLLALDPALVRIATAMPAEAWILVGEFNLPALKRAALERRLGGVAGHYLLTTQSVIDEMHAHNKKAGVGFCPSKNLLNREWRRGVDWVFTNHAAKLCEPKS